MERHANKTNAPETIKTLPQSLSKSGKTIFAYMRRSTSKIGQADSLIQQEDGIDSMVRKLGYENETIKYFAETHSGFENKKRKKWGEMIIEVDRLGKPCIIIARDISRLSRNPTDSQWIMDRLYGDNGNKKIIEKIYTLDFDNIKEWSSASDKEEVHKALSSSYYDSLDTKRKSIGGILLKLEKGEFPYRAPKGMDNYVLNGKRILKQNEKISYVRRAFEMKIDGKSHKEISKYLRRYGDIKIGERELTDTLFKNPVYIGEYTEKTQGNHYTGLLFFEGSSPISRTLWNKVQSCLGKKHSKYGEKQEGDVLGEKLRTAEGRRMTRYMAKGKYANYTNAIEKIHITETKILEDFMRAIHDMIIEIDQNDSRAFIRDNFSEIDYTFFRAGIEEMRNEYPQSEVLDFSEEEIKKILHTTPWTDTEEDNLLYILERIEFGRNYLSDLATPYLWTTYNSNPEVVCSKTLAKLSSYMEQLHTQEISVIKRDRDIQMKKMQTSIDGEKQILKQYIKLRANGEISLEEMQEMKSDSENTIKMLEEQMTEISQISDIEKYIEHLPLILQTTFELAQESLQEEETGLRNMMLKKLLELTTFELTVNNKKELEVKLFDVLGGLTQMKISVWRHQSDLNRRL